MHVLLTNGKKGRGRARYEGGRHEGHRHLHAPADAVGGDGVGAGVAGRNT